MSDQDTRLLSQLGQATLTRTRDLMPNEAVKYYTITAAESRITELEAALRELYDDSPHLAKGLLTERIDALLKPETDAQRRRKRLENAARNCIRPYEGKHGAAEREDDIAQLMACYDLIDSQADGEGNAR